MANQKIGGITHFYDKISVAVVKLTKGDLKTGDTIKLVGADDKPFTQKVSSMQIEHADIDIAKVGDIFGLKVDSPVKTKSEVIKVK